jgi:hypothetical protein
MLVILLMILFASVAFGKRSGADQEHEQDQEHEHEKPGPLSQPGF